MGIKIGMVSLGCAKNRVDAELMLGVLLSDGFELETDPAKADAIIVNTCGFIESAKEESIRRFSIWRNTKRVESSKSCS